MTTIPRATRVLQRGVDRGLHLGAQVSVWHGGETVADFAVGEARAGVPMSTDSMATWFSMTKPTVAVAVAQLWERGEVAVDDPVARYVPEFAQHGKERITLRHLLTHTGGFRGADQVASDAPGDAYWDELVTGICAVAPEEGWVPGERAGYHLGCGMTMLAEIVRRVDGRRFEHYVRDEVFLPLGMDDCWVGMPPERHAAYGDRIGTMHNTQGDEPVPLDGLDAADVMARCVPGGGGRGPMRELGRLYRALLGGGELDGVRILSPQTVAAISARHRVGLYDETFHCECDWGLGFAVDNFAMGRHASPRAFGHGGALSSYAFADPEHDLAVAVQTNGMCASDEHYQRLDDVMTALYLDLGIVAGDAKGRDKAMPQLGPVRL
ncbi:MAG TPA: serine hydrolase domain-containing protein [Acidimicrobiia bacterium]|nr:serine hydrolase domain-containing protein [Acidimicrobiia bacterium]